MTIRISPENFLDKVLKLFGKERQVIMPERSMRTKGLMCR